MSESSILGEENLPSFVTWWSQKFRGKLTQHSNKTNFQWKYIEASRCLCTCLERKLFPLQKLCQLAILIKIIKLQKKRKTKQIAWNMRLCYRNRKSTRQGFKLFIRKEIRKENAIHFVTLTSCKVTLMAKKWRTFLHLIGLWLTEKKKNQKKKSKSSNQFSIIIIDFFL